jgi:CelD/BcsL family acetyltransferase involved in cellulose biosynthesis
MERCRTELLHPVEMTGHIAAWAGLIERCLEPSVFNEPAFALPAARHIPSFARPRFLLVWDEQAQGDPVLIGLCPVKISRFGWAGMPVSAWMHDQATAAFPLLDRDAAKRALSAMLQHVAKAPGRPAAVFFQGLPKDGATAQLLRRQAEWITLPVELRTRAVLWRGGQPTMPAKARKELRRQSRRLSDQGDLRWESARSVETIGADVERFLALEAKGWKGRRGTALLQSDHLRTFTRCMTIGLAASGQCRIDGLTLDGQPVAMAIVLRSRDRAYYWKTAYDEAFRRLSPGVQLTLAITEAQRKEAGLSMTDSCAVPGHTMIDRVWRARMEVVDVMLATRGRGVGFVMTVRLERSRRFLKRMIKRGLSMARLRRLRGGTVT